MQQQLRSKWLYLFEMLEFARNWLQLLLVKRMQWLFGWLHVRIWGLLLRQWPIPDRQQLPPLPDRLHVLLKLDNVLKLLHRLLPREQLMRHLSSQLR